MIWTPDLLPWVCGSDVVGTVAALGPTTTTTTAPSKFAVGDKVMFLAPTFDGLGAQCGLQEYALADTNGAICRVPTPLSEDEAATFPLNLSTVFVALFLVLGIKLPWEDTGDVPAHLLIVGGGSNCGNFAVQLARLAGIENVVVVGGDAAELAARGATHVLDRHAAPEDVVRQVKDLTADDLVYALDTVNETPGLALSFAALSSTRPGVLAWLLPRRSVGEELKRGHEVREVLAAEYARDARAMEMWERLPGWIEQGLLRPTGWVDAGGLTAGAVNAALDAYRDGRSQGQPHLRVS